MSTPNFNIINAHRVYAVFDRDPEEGYERDEYDIRDMLDDFVGCLNENTHHPQWHGFKRVSEHAGDRNYPVLVWARRTIRKTFCRHFAEKQAVCLGVFSNGEAIYEEVA